MKNQKRRLNKRQASHRRTLKLFKRLMGAFAVPEPMTVSQWADRYRVLSPEASAEVGRWHTDRAPYQREIMDALSDPQVQKIVIKASAQVGKTEIILNCIGYYIDHDPAPILYVLPTDLMAEEWKRNDYRKRLSYKRQYFRAIFCYFLKLRSVIAYEINYRRHRLRRHRDAVHRGADGACTAGGSTAQRGHIPDADSG